MRVTSAVAPTLLLALAATARGQVSGNLGYAQAGGRARAEQAERGKRVIAENDLPPSAKSVFVEANVLMNVRADEFVATFGIAREGETVAACARAMEATIEEFSGALRRLGVEADDLAVDFVAQARIYGIEATGDIAREKPVGFELKKNISIRYSDRARLDRLVAAAAEARIFDLIKVDAVVKDPGRVQDRLMEEAARVLRRKRGRYESLLGLKLRPPAQVVAERYATYPPAGLYDSYTAFEAERMEPGGSPDRPRYTVQAARKGRTFFYNGLDADGFDAVVDPVVLDPPVQFTLYLKVTCEVEPTPAD